MEASRLLFRNNRVATLVATLLLWKSTKFHDKKTLDSQKNTRLQNIDQSSKGIQCK